MPVFSTPDPVHLVVDVGGCTLTVRAADVAEASVDVRPNNPARTGDTELAARVTAELSGTRLTVTAPRSKMSRLRSLIGPGSDRLEIDVTVPEGSTLEMRGWGDVAAEGRLESVEVDTGMGDIRLDRVAGVRAKTGMGDIQIGEATGPAEMRTAMGSLRIGHGAGAVTAWTSAGDIRVDDGEGQLKLTTPAGDVRVGRARAGVTVKTSAGDIRLGSVASGSVNASTSYGQLEIGVAHGSAAWLDVEARHGAVRSELENSDGPGSAELTVEIHATTGYGDIVLRRA